MDTLPVPTPSSILPPPPPPENLAAHSLNSTADIPRTKPAEGEIKSDNKKRKKSFNTKKKLNSEDASSSSSSCSQSFPNPNRKKLRVAYKRRIPSMRLGPVRRSVLAQEIGALALPVGMSIAAFVNLVLERKDIIGQSVSVDDLQTICTSAVRESLAIKGYGDKSDCFWRNFEKSFGSTLRTLRQLNGSSLNKESHCIDHHPELEPTITGVSNLISASEDFELSSMNGSLTEELDLRGEGNQLACIPRNPSFTNPIERSLVERTRANNLKTVELGLTLRKLELKEEQIAAINEANRLERSKLEVGAVKFTLKAEKFKTEVEETRQAELLKRCIDCLVAGLFIMLAALLYGAYVFSYQNITEATSACMPSPQESSSWWIPERVSSMNSGLNILKCQIRVITQMLFGLLIIISIAYAIILRSSASKQTMPITFILLLLGVLCGVAGKFCVDTLGGSGYHWLVLWETMCLIHFLSNVFTSVLFLILYGPITVAGVRQKGLIFPYGVRRAFFYGIVVLFLPVFCGFVPFASLSEWKDHLFQVVGFLGEEGKESYIHG